MDAYDFEAMAELLADRQDLWVHDSIYPGSCILTDEGQEERDRLAAQYRHLANEENAKLDAIIRTFPLHLSHVRKEGLDELLQTDREWCRTWFQQIAKLAQDGSEEARRAKVIR